MTRKADAEQTAMRNQRRQEQLATQDRLLQSVEMLDRDATARVLQSAPANIIMLVHSRTATVYIPSFQFNEDGTPRPKVQLVNQTRHTSSALDNGSWFDLNWWTTEMRLDVSDPESRPFRPIDVVTNDATLDALVGWIKGWEGESY